MVNEYNSISANEQKLFEISMDDVSGIDTMMNNINRSSNLQIETVGVVPSKVTKPVESNLPGIVITPIYNEKEPVTEESKITNKIDGLDDKTKNKAIIVLLAISLIFIAIAIFK